MGDRERHGEVGQLRPGLFGDREEPLDGVEATFGAVVRAAESVAVAVGPSTPAEASGEHAPGERAPDEGAIPC
ncbi:hypothetical protein V1634_19675 [Plantactinospora veratri]|uniref:Uncharacterized protein n=1 Tax=Plantactinospora veratri TaxID=1436122 RepID=A0ABU7SGN3_9ACTN